VWGFVEDYSLEMVIGVTTQLEAKTASKPVRISLVLQMVLNLKLKLGIVDSFKNTSDSLLRFPNQG
jgi:hypothetical protein